jgi:hypothetical protein
MIFRSMLFERDHTDSSENKSKNKTLEKMLPSILRVYKCPEHAG